MGTHSALLSSEARVSTTASRRYMAQLCKHFAHRIPATFDDTRGRIEFAAGACDLTADSDAGILVMRVVAADEASLAKVEDVVARHLVRFAFREEPEVNWTRAA